MGLQISDNLITYSAEVLAQTENGMTWAQIAKFFRKKSVEYKVAAPYVTTNISLTPSRSQGRFYPEPKGIFTTATTHLAKRVM